MGLLYSQMKIFHFKEKLDSLPEDSGIHSPPLHIRIKPTNVCAHSCSYCAYTASNLQLGKDMNERDSIPKAKMLEIIDDLAEMGVGAVTFSGGGDPFYYPHLLDAVNKLSATKVKFACLTNGARLKGELADVFAERGSWLRISIDGWDAKSYAQYRGIGEGEFDIVMKNIESFKRLGGDCYLGAVIVVDKKNAEHIFELASKLREAGVDSVKISPCIVSNDGRQNNEYHSPIYESVKAQALRVAQESAGEDFEVFDSYHLLEEKFTKKYTWCPYLQILPVIAADQVVYSCHDKAYNLDCGVLGSIKDRRFKDFWMSDKSRLYKINPSVDCDHHCAVNGHNQLIWKYLMINKDHLEFV